MVRGSNRGGGKRFSVLQNVRIDSGAHPASYIGGAGVFSPRVKRPGHKVNHSPLVPRLRMGGSVPLVPYVLS
jgi:hypothetical protein